MRKGLSIILSILALSSIAVAAYAWANALLNSIYGYRTPLKGTPPLIKDITRPLTSQLILVLIDGLRYDTSLQMPYLNDLRQQGAQAKLTSRPPSNTQTAWTALITGANPETNGMPLFDRSCEWLVPIAADHLFAAVNRAGLTSGISGSNCWEKLIPPGLLYTKYFVDTKDETADERVVTNALVFLNEFRPNFLLVHLQQAEAAGQKYGGTSHEYQQAALRCDEHIRSLAMGIDLKRSVLLIVSSHGHLDAGGHGGSEAITLNMPFLMIGENISPGDYGVLAQTDVAPTVAALLGTPIPSAAQGYMRVDMLQMNAADRAEKLVSLASQRVRIGSIYLYSVGEGALGETADGDMLVALSSLQVKNYESASELASISVEQTYREMAQARRARLWRERTQRAGPVALVILIPLWVIWRVRSKQAAWTALAGLLAAALYHTMFLLQGNTYSFSHIPANGLAATLNPGLRRAAIALAVGALLIIWQTWRKREQSIFAVVMHSYAYAAMQLYWIGLVLGACIWWSGLHFTWYLPDFTIAYVHLATLMQAMLIAALSIPLPLVVVILQRGLLRITGRHALPPQVVHASHNT